MSISKSWPKITVVTPSYNQGQYLEQAICSVLDQKYPNLEYIIIDGGSSDNSINIIKKYERHIDYWVSEKDTGQYNAINRGFSKSSGEIMAWLNSDDTYCPWVFQVVADIFQQNKRVEWITTLYPLILGRDNSVIACGKSPGYSRSGFYSGRYCGINPKRALHFIPQESTFWRRLLWERAGSCLGEKYDLAEDFHLWAKFFEHSNLFGVNVPIATFRIHNDQKSFHIERYNRECSMILRKYRRQAKLELVKHVLAKCGLNRIPIIKELSNILFGDKLFTIVSVSGEQGTTWKTIMTKALI